MGGMGNACQKIDSHHECPNANHVFDLNNILDRFIYKDSSRDRILRFSHRGEGLVVWKGCAPRLIMTIRIDIKYGGEFLATYDSQNEGRDGQEGRWEKRR